jgi:hypothetical protein
VEVTWATAWRHAGCAAGSKKAQNSLTLLLFTAATYAVTSAPGAVPAA